MGRFESVQVCKKHPSINKSPGVCSNCLEERLSQLNSYSSNNKISYAFSSSPYSSSTSSSNYVSSANRLRQHRRNASEALGPSSFIFNSSSSGLEKSKSIAVVEKNQFGDINKDENNKRKNKKKKKSGFWFKLLGTSSGNKNKD